MWDLGKLGFVWQFITVSASRKYFAERLPLTFKSCFSSPVFTRTPTSQTSLPRASRRLVLHASEVLRSTIRTDVRFFFFPSQLQDGMKAYVGLVQQREREIGCDVLTHQKVRVSCPPSSFSHDRSLNRFLPVRSGLAPTTPTTSSRRSLVASPRLPRWGRELRKGTSRRDCYISLFIRSG